MRPLKIIYVFGLPVRIGGHYKSGLAMVKSLHAMGHHVIVLAPDGVDEMVQEFTQTGAEFYRLDKLKKWNRRLRLPTVAGTGRIIRLAKERSVDIIHGQDFAACGRAYMAAIASARGFVTTFAGGPFSHEPPPTQSDVVLFCQEQVQTFSKAYQTVEDNIHLIRARIDLDIYKPEEVHPTFVSKYGLPVSGQKIAIAMRLHPIKKQWLRTIIETAKAFCDNNRNTRIIIAGEGPLLNNLRAQAIKINRQCRNGPVIQFVGPIFSLQELNQFYNYADVVAGTGRGILEAMACRKPVVILSENCQGEMITPENIEDIAYYNFSGRHFRYLSETAAPLASVLEKLLTDGDLRKRLGDYSYEYIRSNMDAQIGAKQLLEVYQKAVNQRASLFDYVIWYFRAVYYRIVRVITMLY